MARFNSYDDIASLADDDEFLVEDVDAEALKNITWANLKTALSLGTLYQLSHNLIKNYPSLEGADGTAPLWWSSANATITEEDAAGEGLTSPPNERVLKVVTSAPNGIIRQDFVPANERLLSDSNTTVSFGAKVWVVTAGTLTLRLLDSAAGTIVSTTTTTTGGWVYLYVTGTIGANTLRAEILHSASGATFYVANPQLNTGPAVAPFRPRGLIPRYGIDNIGVLDVDPGGSPAGWVAVDITAYTSANTVMADLVVVYACNVANRTITLRTYGVGGGYSWATNQLASTTIFYRQIGRILLDDQQRFEYSSSAAAGDTERLFIAIAGQYYEWE